MDNPDESPLTIFQYLDTNKNGRISLTEFSNKRGRKLVELVMKRNDPSKKISKKFLTQAFKNLAKNVKKAMKKGLEPKEIDDSLVGVDIFQKPKNSNLAI